MANDSVSLLKKLQAEARMLLTGKGIEALDETQLHPFKHFILFWARVAKSFVRNRCLVRASALAYTTLLALIPLLAVALSVSSSLLQSSPEQRNKLITQIIDGLAPQFNDLPGGELEKADAKQRVINTIQDFIAKVHSGVLGITGTVALVFVAIGLLSTIEATFNDIWGVPQGRNWLVRIVHYWTAITLLPLIAILLMGLAIGSQFQTAEQYIQDTPLIGSLIFKLAPFFVLSGSFTLIYQFMPNTKVHWKSALAGGLVAGVLWIANGNLNALFASRVVSASKIYGSLAAIPVFLLGLYFSWTILLFGAQVSYAFQNRRAYFQEKQAENVNQRGREFVALRLMTVVGQRFQNGEMPPGSSEIATALSVPSRLVTQIIQPLLHAKLLVEVGAPETAYSPARPLEKISCQNILQALRAGQGQEPPTREEPMREQVRGAFDEIQKAEQQVAETVTLQTMIDQAHGKSRKGIA